MGAASQTTRAMFGPSARRTAWNRGCAMRSWSGPCLDDTARRTDGGYGMLLGRPGLGFAVCSGREREGAQTILAVHNPREVLPLLHRLAGQGWSPRLLGPSSTVTLRPSPGTPRQGLE